MNKDLYLDCRSIMKKFIKKEYWLAFSSADLFYIINGRKKALFSFVEQFFGDAYGCQLFFNADGFNYVHDILTTKSEMSVSLCDCDSLCAVLLSKEELRKEDKDFLRKNHFRVMENNNFIIYRFQPGFTQRIANTEETRTMFMYLEFIASLIENEFDDIIEAFRKSDTVIAMMNRKLLEYSIFYHNLPYLEVLPKKSPANEEFAIEFKDTIYLNDECYFFSAYLPLIIKETGIRPMILYFYFPKLKKHHFKYIMTDPKEYKNLIFGIIYDVFTEIGVPYKISFNHRTIYALLENTISLMNIEHIFMRENHQVDSNMNDLIAKIYQQVDDEYVEKEEFIKMLMDTITYTLNEMTDFDEEEIEEKKDDFIS